MKIGLALALALALWAASGTAQAQSIACAVTMSDIQFGTVGGIGQGPSDVNGNLNVFCLNATTPYVRVCVALGAPVSGSYDPRTMAGPTERRLAYNIHTDPGHTQIWGSDTSTVGGPRAIDVSTRFGVGAAGAPYYARVPVQNGTPTGAYSARFAATGDATVRARGYTGAPPACSTSMPIVARFSFSVNAEVTGDCAVSATDLAFGGVGIDLFDRPVEATSSITMTCTEGTNYEIALDAGQSIGASVRDRRLTRAGGGDTLQYQLYSNSARTAIWGDGGIGTRTEAGTGAGGLTPITHIVYGEIERQRTPESGEYNDMITVTVTY